MMMRIGLITIIIALLVGFLPAGFAVAETSSSHIPADDLISQPNLEFMILDEEDEFQNFLYSDFYGMEEVDEAQKKEGGLPQLDPKYFPSQIFWLAITFISLYLIFARKVLPELGGTIDDRNTRIENDLSQAQKLRDAAEKLRAEYESALELARADASQAYSKTEQQIKDKTQSTINTFRERSLSQMQKAEQRIENSRKEALKEMDTIAAEIATQAAEKIIGVRTDISKAKTVVENLNKEAA